MNKFSFIVHIGLNCFVVLGISESNPRSWASLRMWVRPEFSFEVFVLVLRSFISLKRICDCGTASFGINPHLVNVIRSSIVVKPPSANKFLIGVVRCARRLLRIAV